MTHTQTDVFFYEDGRFEEGYKPGTIRMRMDNGMGGVNVHIMTDDPREQLRELRDLCQSQIDALDVQREPLRCPSVHGDQRCHWMLGHKGPHQEGNEVWIHDAPIGQAAAPPISREDISKSLRGVETIDSESADLIVDIASGRVLKDRTGETGRILHAPDCMCPTCDIPF